MDRRVALLYLLSAALLWSLGGLLIKIIDWHPMAIAGARSGISALFLLAVIRKPRFNFSLLQIGGGFAYASTVILFVLATKLTTAANAILLQYTAPVYVALLSTWVLGEPVTRRNWVTILICLGGLLLFFLDRLSTSGLVGNLCAILSGMSFAGLALLLRKQRFASPQAAVIWGNALAAVICLPFYFSSPPDPMGWGALLILGIIQLGLSYLLYTKAITHIRAVEAIVVPMIEPILNPLWVFLFLGEKPGPWALAGGVVVLVTIAVHGVLLARSRLKTGQ